MECSTLYFFSKASSQIKRKKFKNLAEVDVIEIKYFIKSGIKIAEEPHNFFTDNKNQQGVFFFIFETIG
jgi:hypothetical protein